MSTLVIDTHELGRRPGTEKTSTRMIETPADLGLDVYRVAEGTEIALELRLEAVMDGVLVTGQTQVRAVGDCVRCLKDVSDDFEIDFQDMYFYESTDPDELVMDGDLLDLEPVFRDAVLLALPHNPLCGPDCPGLCPDCGARLADDPDHTHAEAIDPRWSALQNLTDLPKE